MRGSGHGTLQSPDRALRELQEKVLSLELQLSGRSTSETRQQYRGDNRGGFARTGRGLEQTAHELITSDFRPALAKPHVIAEAVQALEITEAYWYPAEAWTADATNYSWIALRLRTATGRRLGYISGQPKAVGPWATGSLVVGEKYRFDLASQPRLSAGQSLVLISTAQTNPGVWPPGTVIVCWRWL